LRLSIAANIVAGCGRSSQNEYVRFLEIADGSARELLYEISLCERLAFLEPEAGQRLQTECTNTAKALNGLLRALRKHQDQRPDKRFPSASSSG